MRLVVRVIDYSGDMVTGKVIVNDVSVSIRGVSEPGYSVIGVLDTCRGNLLRYGNDISLHVTYRKIVL